MAYAPLASVDASIFARTSSSSVRSAPNASLAHDHREAARLVALARSPRVNPNDAVVVRRRSASVTYRLRRWPLYLVAFNPLVVLRLRLLPQVIGGGLFGSGQRAGRRSTHAAQALKEEAQAIHAESVPVVYGYHSSEFARSGRRQRGDEGCEVPGLRRS